MPELKSLARERRLRGYCRMRRAELVALLQNINPPSQSHASAAPSPQTRPPPPPPPTQTWEPIDDRRPRKPSPQEMDIFEQQEMSNSRPQVKGKLNKWYDWLINHVPKPVNPILPGGGGGKIRPPSCFSSTILKRLKVSS